MDGPIGYVIRGPDIDVRFFDGAPVGIICRQCKSCLSHAYVPQSVNIPTSHQYGFGHTRDLQPLFSQELITIIRGETEQEFAQISFPNIADYSVVITQEIVEFDAKRRNVKFGPRCQFCDSHSYIVGATPAYLRAKALPDNGFFKTDLQFGGENGKSCLFIIGKKLKQKIQSRNLRGVYFSDAFG